MCIEAYYHSLRSGVSHAYASVDDSVDALVRIVLIGGALIPVGVVLLTEPGYRRAALWQLRFPAVAVGGYLALYLALSLGLPPLLVVRTGAHRFLESLLAPLTGTFIAWGVAVNTVPAGGTSDVPPGVAVVLPVGGPISVTAVSALEVARLWRRYPDDFPFRRGPL